MELYHEIKADAYVIILAGTIDEGNAGELNLALHKAIKSGREKILVDGLKLTCISLEGIGVFLSNLPHLRQKGIQLTFEGLNAKTRQLYHNLGLDFLLSLPDPSIVV